MRGAEEEEVEGVHEQEEDEIQEILLSPFFLPYTLIFIVISWRVCCGYLMGSHSFAIAIAPPEHTTDYDTPETCPPPPPPTFIYGAEQL